MSVLETDRLVFRDHLPEDLEPFCEMESDPVFRGAQPVHPRSELERSFQEAWLPPKPLGLLATVFKPEARYIGRCGLYPHRNDDGEVIPKEATLAYYLARPYWGRGLATEAGQAFVRHGFQSLGLTRIFAGMNALNQASIRIVEKLGFTRVRSGEGGGNRWHEYELRNPAFTEAVAALKRGDFTACDPLFEEPSKIIDWFDLFQSETAALAEAFTCACFNGRTAIARHLLDKGMNPAGGMGTGLNAAHWAANRGQVEVVRLLIERGTPLEAVNMYGGTVLGATVWAAINEPRGGQLEVIELLLQAGAKVEQAGYPTGNGAVDELFRRHAAQA